MPLILRYLGFAVSWAGFALSFTILFLSMRAILAIGGFCAEGGPYVIQTHCPGNSGWLTPISIYLGLASVAIGVLVARGLGASLTLLAWPILFIGLGGNFLQSGFPTDGGIELTGLLLGVMFVVMGAIPLIAWLRQPGNISAAVAGTSHLDGTSIGSASFLFRRAPNQEPTLGLTPIDYAVLVPLWLLAAAFGVWVGFLWFNA